MTARPGTSGARPPGCWTPARTWTSAAGRHLKLRRLDVMIAAVASVRGLLLYPRNAADVTGLESMLDVVEV